MKFIVKVDCSPEEARQFLGLPDVQAFQVEVMEMVKQRTTEHLKAMDPETMMKTWMPLGMETVSTMQKAFLNSMSGVTPKRESKD